ncbi:enhancer of split m5 protein-like [Musca domestica]|uniref:Enhancer of split m5 protein-like n=1 Tax=Musca domestica TaxID=7370 RepID=A0A1I8N652_MUSDO|nr:enhancer of split m5 protein-like [Musca domestica]
MAPQMEFVSKTQHYLKVKKPQLERERRARINKCLDTLKVLVADLQGNGNILRMDKTEMLESVVAFMRTQVRKPKAPMAPTVPMDSYRHGYMNAVNEVSRIMAATPGMNVQLGKAVMTHLGCAFNQLTASPASVQKSQDHQMYSAAPMSPASSGYHSDEENSSVASPAPVAASLWRPW